MNRAVECVTAMAKKPYITTWRAWLQSCYKSAWPNLPCPALFQAEEHFIKQTSPAQSVSDMDRVNTLFHFQDIDSVGLLCKFSAKRLS